MSACLGGVEADSGAGTNVSLPVPGRMSVPTVEAPGARNQARSRAHVRVEAAGGQRERACAHGRAAGEHERAVGSPCSTRTAPTASSATAIQRRRRRSKSATARLCGVLPSGYERRVKPPRDRSRSTTTRRRAPAWATARSGQPSRSKLAVARSRGSVPVSVLAGGSEAAQPVAAQDGDGAALSPRPRRPCACRGRSPP